ncbi:hypothetical protein GC105_16190 [Alkalibaculum sp. M08DMB]|uniref:PucR C-terminal helix-turn-helix domain-containing protein n=1 Tax=Alkalibaculum sporogenes TaxID=2655001 RepID=A0A6A7KDA1_9FIRM|nr:helix-turn-helix domain-containing protein [Alkalibaculum sporogenes]MPW27306.1 hypothetical protein [Alkalibaculum sporogenes]
MKLNMHVLCDELSEVIEEIRCNPSIELALSGVKLFCDDIKNDVKERVYVYICGDEFPKHDFDVYCINAIILINDESISKLEIPDHVDIIRISAKSKNNVTEEINNIYKRVVDIFEKYNSWFDNLMHSILNNEPIGKMLNISAQVLKNPIALIDNTAACTAWSGSFPNDYHDEIWDDLFKHYYGGTSICYNMFSSAKHYASGKIHFVAKNESSIGREAVAVEIYAYNKDTHPIGFLGSTQVWSHFTAGQFSLLLKISWCLGNVVSIVNMFKREQVTLNLLRGKSIRENIVAYYVKQHFGTKKKYFRVLVLDFKSIKNDEESRRDLANLYVTYTSRTERELKTNEITVIYKRYLVIIFNDLFTKNDIIKKHQDMEDLFYLHDFVIGISEVFETYGKLKNYLEQAMAGIELGSVKDPSQETYYFRDYSIEYLYEKTKDIVDMNTFSHPMALRIYHYDKEHHTDYLKILGMYYFNNGNKLKTAEELYIHRNTLQYKLDAIKEILGIDEFELKEALDIIYTCRVLHWIELRKKCKTAQI